jgi:hypothetical protein
MVDGSGEAADVTFEDGYYKLECYLLVHAITPYL